MKRCMFCREIIKYDELKGKWMLLYPIMKQFAYVCNDSSEGHKPK